MMTVNNRLAPGKKASVSSHSTTSSQKPLLLHRHHKQYLSVETASGEEEANNSSANCSPVESFLSASPSFASATTLGSEEEMPRISSHAPPDPLPLQPLAANYLFAEEMVKPYVHQVGGHECLLSLGREHICKPLHETEPVFYRQMPRELREFTPRLCLDAELSLHPSNSELVLNLGPRSLLTATQCCSKCRGETKENFSARHNRLPSGLAEKEKEIRFRDVSSGLASPVNPWAFHCQMKNLAKKPMSVNKSNRYLVFENLTARYHRPCILDIKLGTRQHGDSASKEKRLLQQWKCLRTTSKAMGMRICGMQYFDTPSETYQCMDKYAGRDLDKEGVRKLLKKFFRHSSTSTSRGESACVGVLDKLRGVIKIISQLDGYRFFGTSLLIVYEGCPTEGVRLPPPDVRLIDFANVSLPLEDESSNVIRGYSGPDSGCLLGLKTLENILLQCAHN